MLDTVFNQVKSLLSPLFGMTDRTQILPTHPFDFLEDPDSSGLILVLRIAIAHIIKTLRIHFPFKLEELSLSVVQNFKVLFWTLPRKLIHGVVS